MLTWQTEPLPRLCSLGLFFLRKENVYVLVSHILWVVDVHINGSDVDMIGAVCTIKKKKKKECANIISGV